MNCTFPAPVKARAKVIKHIPPLIFGAFAEFLPEEAIAAAGGIFPFHVVGHDDTFGRYAVHMLPHGGLGATQDADGWLPAAYPHNSTVTPTEIIERQSPVIMTRKAMIPDSGGAGRRRGGLGQEIAVRCARDTEALLTVRPDLLHYPAPGLEGGSDGMRGDVVLNGERATRFTPFPWRNGDEVVMKVPGGGGFGPASERDRDALLRDVVLGLVTPQAAQRDYGLEERLDAHELRVQALRDWIARGKAGT